VQLFIDNTTLHRIGAGMPAGRMPLSDAELANVLHVIEVLVMSDHLIVNGFESTKSQERSDQILEYLAAHGHDELISVSSLSTPDAQKAIAMAVAAELDSRDLILGVGPPESEVNEIDARLGRPIGVVDVAADSMDQMAGRFEDAALAEDFAHQAVEDHRTDGLFVYGLLMHPGLREKVARAYSEASRPSTEDWLRYHVVFRSVFNQQMAERDGMRAYAPPPVRAAVLRNVYSRTLEQLRVRTSEVTLAFQEHLGNRAFAEDLLEHAPRPLPLMGLAYMLNASTQLGLDDSFPNRVAHARELARPMRERLAALDELAVQEPGRYFRELQREIESFQDFARRFLSIDAQGLTVHFDAAVTVGPDGVSAISLDVDGGFKVTHLTRALDRVNGRRQRMSVLSDGIALTGLKSTLYDAVRHALR
jgi:hypothetical protein